MGLVGRGRGARWGGVGRVVGTRRRIIEEVEASAEAEWVVLGFVKGVPLRLGPEFFWVLWHCRSW